MTEAKSSLYAVLPAGGPGTRLWPLSRTDRPKFLLDLTGTGRSLLQQTWDRLTQVTDADRIVVVTGELHARAVAAQLPTLMAHNLIHEPSSRDTAPAICLAAAVIARRDPDAIIASFPADHLIENEVEFRRSVSAAVEAAQAGYIVTIGITPTGPSTAYGYIQTGEQLPIDKSDALRAIRFVEKPDETRASEYLTEGNWLWNAGIFVARAQTLLSELEARQRALYEAVSDLAERWDGGKRPEPESSSAWEILQSISIDHALAEPLAPIGRVAVVPAALGWDDIGDWAALSAILAPDGNMAPAVLGDLARVLASESSGLVVAQGGREVEVHGVNDIIVVDTPDVLLVMAKDRAQEVKHIVQDLKERGRLDLI